MNNAQRWWLAIVLSWLCLAPSLQAQTLEQVLTQLDMAGTALDYHYFREDYIWAIQFEKPAEDVEVILQKAKNGDRDAQTTLGHMYFLGTGAKKSYKNAHRWFSLAAGANDPLAIDRLGLMYLIGAGLPQNYDEAVDLFKRSAELNNTCGQFHYGIMLQYGLGILPDKERARYWLERAADGEYDIAEAYFGFQLIRGEIVPQDLVRAYRYWSLAVAHGFEEIAPERNLLTHFLTPDQLRRVQDSLTKSYAFEQNQPPLTVTVLGPKPTPKPPAETP